MTDFDYFKWSRENPPEEGDLKPSRKVLGLSFDEDTYGVHSRIWQEIGHTEPFETETGAQRLRSVSSDSPVQHRVQVHLPEGGLDNGMDTIIENWSKVGQGLAREFLRRWGVVDPYKITKWEMHFSDYQEWQQEGIVRGFEQTILHAQESDELSLIERRTVADFMTRMAFLTKTEILTVYPSKVRGEDGG